MKKKKKKRTYITPKVQEMEFTTVRIIATSGLDPVFNDPFYGEQTW